MQRHIFFTADGSEEGNVLEIDGWVMKFSIGTAIKTKESVYKIKSIYETKSTFEYMLTKGVK